MKKVLVFVLAIFFGGGCVPFLSEVESNIPDPLEIEAMEASIVGQEVMIYLDCVHNCAKNTVLSTDQCRQKCVEFVEVLRKKL